MLTCSILKFAVAVTHNESLVHCSLAVVSFRASKWHLWTAQLERVSECLVCRLLAKQAHRGLASALAGNYAVQMNRLPAGTWHRTHRL